jgi:polysaccharide biosynthesis protein PslJ
MRTEPAGLKYDAVTLFTVYIVLLIAIPSRLVFSPLGAAGTPAQILGMLMLLWWGTSWLSRTHGFTDPVIPIRRAMLLFAMAVLASYLAAVTRPIEAVELRSADRAILSLCGWVAIVVIAADRIPSRARLDTLLRRLVTAGGWLATLGLLQFITGRQLTNFIQIPGLSPNASLTGVLARDGFARPAGTALHPIEFGVVLTMVLPLALHYAFVDKHRSVLRRWSPVAAIAFAVPISISRSAILAAVVALIFLFPTWPRKTRRNAYATIFVLLCSVYVLVPGLLGTFRNLFFGLQNDSSALSRTDSYALAWEFITRAPFFGRGIGTFLPSYRTLDNGYLGAIIETGFVGLTCLLVLFLSGVIGGRQIRRRSSDPVTRQLGQSLSASMAAGACSYATFDGLGFPMVTGLVFLILGCTAALYRLQVLSGPTPVGTRSQVAAPQPETDLVLMRARTGSGRR